MMKQNYETAGVRESPVGKNKQFKRTIQEPWSYLSKRELNLFELIPAITEKFVVIESISMDNEHTARIADVSNGELLDIKLHSYSIVVYPTTNTHQKSSETLCKIFDRWV